MRRRLTWLALALATLLVALWWSVERGGSGTRGTASAPAETSGQAELVPSFAEDGKQPLEARTVVASTSQAAPTTAPAKEKESVHFRVIVEDERHFPVAGATVELAFPTSGAFRATSDAGGVAVVSVPCPERQENGVARAFDATRAGVIACSLRARGTDRPWHDEVDLGDLILLPGHALSVRVERDRRAAAGVTLTAEVGKLAVLEQTTTDAAGRARFEHVPEAWIVLHAHTADADGWSDVVVPDATQPEIVVALEPLRTLVVRAQEKTSGTPLAGVQIRLHEEPRAPQFPFRNQNYGAGPEREAPATDAAGESRIEGVPARGLFFVSGTRADDPRPQARSDSKVAEGTSEVVLSFPERTPKTLRWPVVAGELPVPAEGTSFDLRTFDWGTTLLPPPWHGRMEQGELVVEGWWGSANLLFRAPDGSLARSTREEKPISFRRPRKLEVRVRAADASPAAEMRVTTAGVGFADQRPSATTDASGLAVLEGIFPARVKVFVGPQNLEAGEVELTEGDGTLEFQMPSAQLIEFRARIGGEARLPRSYWLWSNDSELRFVREVPALGEADYERVSADRKPWTLLFRAEGFQQASRSIEPPAPGEPTIVELELVPAFEVQAEVSGDSGSVPNLSAQTWSEKDGGWRGADTPEGDLQRANGAGGIYRFGGLGPGRYRVADDSTNQVSDEVELDAAHPIGRVHLALAPPVQIIGRVEGPADLDPALVRVHLEGEHIEKGERTIQNDRTFTLELPTGARAYLTVSHPFLSAADGGPVEAVPGAVLHLKEGDEVQLALDPSLASAGNLRPRILRFADEPGPDPLASHETAVVAGVVRFGGVPAGRWSFWIDLGSSSGMAPLVLRGVEVGAGVTKLDAPLFQRGSTLRVRVLNAEGKPVPRISVRAQFLSEPRFVRANRTRAGESLLELPGLAAGLYDVTLNSYDRRFEGDDRPRRLEVDGHGDVEWSLDLR